MAADSILSFAILMNPQRANFEVDIFHPSRFRALRTVNFLFLQKT